MKQIYLDNAATTKMCTAAIEAMQPYFKDIYGNPSGLHLHARDAKRALNKSRNQISEILNCTPEEIIFTGSGTESDNLAIFGTVNKNYSSEKNHIITNSIEHPAVLEPFKKLEKSNFECTFIKPNHYGEITSDVFQKNIKKNSLFASIMYANNELGTINNIKEIAKIAKQNNIIFHTDACQAGGIFDLDTKKLGIDLMTLNGSKINGPKGIGLLYIRKGIQIEPIIFGGQQEYGLRAGTENLANIAGLAASLKYAQTKLKSKNNRLKKLQKLIINTVLKEIPNCRLNGDPVNRLPNNIHFSFLNSEGESLVLLLDKAGYSVATGSACSSESLEPSHVLSGIGMPAEIAHGSIRITLGIDTKKEDIDNFLSILPEIIEKVRKMSPVKFDKSDFPKWFS